jgi:Ca-activated chloride channel family protein
LGRKVLIVLSDGENYPYTRYEEEPHPDYGTHVFEYQEPIEVMQREGISVFAIHFARERDEHLSDIARETGGRVYDARNESELASVYSDIRRRVLEEYYLTYRASMSPADRTYVRVRFDRDAAPVAGETASAETDAFQADATATRYYYSTTILGKPGDGFNWLYLLALPGAVLLWFGLAQLRFRNRRRDANLELLGEGARTRVTGLSGAQTVIGASEDADVTIAGQPSVQSRHATVVRDEKKGSYTVVGEAPIRVNNRPVSKKELEPGDVISVGDATVVFDGPPESSSEDAPEKDESEGSEEAERGSDKGKGKRGSGKGKKEE